jgi:hypothetical protein
MRPDAAPLQQALQYLFRGAGRPEPGLRSILEYTGEHGSSVKEVARHGTSHISANCPDIRHNAAFALQPM